MSQTATSDHLEDNPEPAVGVEVPPTNGSPQQINAETKNALLVVAALVMTATYQAALQPPGGLWQDDSTGSNSTNTNSDNPAAGKSIMGTKIPATYVLFLFFNSMGFFGSYTIIWSLLEGFPMKWRLRLMLVAVVCTYVVSMGALNPSSVLNWIFFVMSAIFPAICSMIMYFAEAIRRKQASSNGNSDNHSSGKAV